MNSNTIILVLIIIGFSYFALGEITQSIDTVNSSSFIVNDDREFNYNVSVDCENCSDLYVSRTGDNVTGDFNFSDTVFIREDGTVSAVVYEGDGSPLTGVGEAAATALTMSGRTTETINKGQCVHISGATGTTPDVSLCDNTHIDKHSMFGIAAESKTEHQPILLRIRGELTSVNTSGYAENATLYMSTAGNFVTSAPAAGAIVMCGHVVNVHVSNGVIVVDDLLDHEVGAADNEDYTHRLGATANYIIKNSTNGVMALWYDNANFTALQGTYEFVEPIITNGSDLYDVNFTENDTLQTITDRGAVTTNNITISNLTANYVFADGSQLTGFVKRELIAEGCFSGVAINITGLNLSIYKKVYVNYNIDYISSATTNAEVLIRFNSDSNNNYEFSYLYFGRRHTGAYHTYSGYVSQPYVKINNVYPPNAQGNIITSDSNLIIETLHGFHTNMYTRGYLSQINAAKTQWVQLTYLNSLTWRNTEDINQIYIWWAYTLEGHYNIIGEY